MRAILVCPDRDLRQHLEQSAAQCRNVALAKSVDFYPSRDALSRMVRVWAPEVLFLSLENPESAAQICQQMEAEFPAVQRIAISDSQDPAILRLALRLRVREALIAPFHEGEFCRVLTEIEKYLEHHPADIGCSDRVFAFLPAKPGVGASTIAASMTRAFAGFPNARPLLADFDSHSGVTGFLFNLDHEFSVADAAKLSSRLDDESWGRLVKPVDNIDLLLSGAPRLDDQEIRAHEIVNLLTFVRRNYTVISADLPDCLDGMTMSILREANRIFLVTTPELPALRLARQKAALFRKLEMEDRVSLLVNRTTKRMELTLDQIEEMIGLQVAASFPSEYRSVMHAVREGTQPESLASAFRDFAQKLLHQQPEVRAKQRSRFIERFAVVPLRYGFR